MGSWLLGGLVEGLNMGITPAGVKMMRSHQLGIQVSQSHHSHISNTHVCTQKGEWNVENWVDDSKISLTTAKPDLHLTDKKKE